MDRINVYLELQKALLVAGNRQGAEIVAEHGRAYIKEKRACLLNREKELERFPMALTAFQKEIKGLI